MAVIVRELYTFSRALHLMRNSGKVMKSIHWSELAIKWNSYKRCIEWVSNDTGELVDLVEALGFEELSDSWVEVK